jgi:biopolymer transport protein ExbB/TolQ
LALQDGIELRETNPEAVPQAIAQGIEVQCAALQGRLPILATVASTAPYIGLFGTVLGILSAFSEIARTGQTGAAVVAAPIAEALTATALGLGVAIPAVMAYNFFNGRINELGLRVETHALYLAARLPAPQIEAEEVN